MSGGDKTIFLDTNVLVYMEVETSPFHLHQAAMQMVKSYYNNGTELWVSRQILREYLVRITHPQTFEKPLPIASAIVRVRYILSRFTVAEDGVHVTEQLLKLLEQVPTGGKQVHDANIVATMLTYNIGHLLTHNVADFSRFAHLITVIPLLQPS